MKKAAVLGYGNIGSGVVSTLIENREHIARMAGEEIVPVKVLDLRSFPGDVMEKNVVRNIEEISGDPEISLVVETMGGTDPAFSFVKACLEAGKHVVSSNKELVAAHGPELLQTAAEHKVNFLFEASAGGAIPIIRPLVTCVTGDPVTKIYGILNGTTNYMLTQMSEAGMDYDAALRNAQELGFAERNPSADVEGFDSCRKIALLASMATHSVVNFKEVPTEGIVHITVADMELAERLGYGLRLLGTFRRENFRMFARVCPMLVRADHPLYAVKGAMNAVFVQGSKMGDLMFYGQGAGKYPTASAVTADLISCVRHPEGGEIPFTLSETLHLTDASMDRSRWFVRFSANPGKKVRDALGKEGKAVSSAENGFAFITGELTGQEVREKAGEGLLAAYRLA